MENTKQIFASQTLNNLNQDVINLYQFLKYNTYKRKEIWDRVIEQSLNEEQKNIFLSDEKSDESEYLEKEIIIPKYNELIKEEKRKNPLFNYFEENGIAPEDRFSPTWFDSVFNFWKETFDKSSSLSKYKVSPTIIINGTKANGDEIDWENFFSFVETIDKNEKDYIINSFKETNTYINKDQKGSCCHTNFIKDKNNSLIPIRSIYLNPYYSPVTTLQTMWHETTHWMQAIDNSNLDEEFEIIEQEKEIEAREKYLNEHKSSYTNDEYRDEIAKLNNDKKNLKNKNIKNKLPNEIQANLNGSMITFIQAIINNCNNLEYVERELIRTTDCDPYGGYCDFLITTENLKKLKTDKNFFNIFVNNGSINFDILDSYTSKVAQKLADEIIEFIERDGRMYIDALEDKVLMADENNPLVKIKQEQRKYWKNNPESEIEKLQIELHCFKKTKDFDHYNYIIHKISLQSLNLANEGLREEKNMNLSVERD